MKKVLILSALLILCIGCTRIEGNNRRYNRGKQYKYKYSLNGI